MESKSANTTNSFFNRLEKFCGQLEKDVDKMRSIYSNPPQSTPQYYDKGLNVFQSEFQALKEQLKITKAKIDEVGQFTNYTESLKELVMQQQEDVRQMELYLAKFGYKVPEMFSERQEDNSSLHCDAARQGSNNNDGPSNDEHVYTPELSNIGKSLHLVGRLPLMQNNDVNSSQLNTPATSNIYSSATKINEWLANVHYEVPITPDVTFKKGEQSLRKREFFKAEKPMAYSVAKSGEEKVIVRIDSFKKPNLKSGKQQTPDEPELSSIYFSGSKYDNHTPEEPILNSKCDTVSNILTQMEQRITPDEPEIYKLEVYSPNSPKLHDVTKKILNIRSLKFNVSDKTEQQSFPTVSAKHVEIKGEAATSQLELDDSLQSPQISEATLCILNAKKV